ncbi:multidrug effflux MFS transporter [Corynebacterium doosanense]|nr:multidrug effflux MFS transporter [Corynebacterium doosanense]
MTSPEPDSYRFSPLLLTSIALLSASAPFSIDMYLPAMPQIAESLGTTAPMVQLTLSGFVMGLAVGQLIIGPVSDGLGRKKLMVGGAVVALLAAVLAATASGIGVLIAARVIQGLGSGACMVVSRAVIPDLAGGRTAAKAFAVMMSIQTLAPVIAPLVGGLLVAPLGWRGLFWVLAGLAGVQLLAAALVIPESRPVEKRSRVTARYVFGNYAHVLRNAGYRGYLLTVVFVFMTLFCYLSASPFLIQDEMGYSPRVFALVFGLNAVGLLVGNLVNARLIDMVDPRRIMRGACLVYVASALTLLAVMLSGTPAHWPVFALLFVSVSTQGLIQTNALSLGQLQVRSHAGSAAALMGFFQFTAAGAVGPLMGLGDSAGLAMALGMACFSVVAAGAAWRATGRQASVD